MGGQNLADKECDIEGHGGHKVKLIPTVTLDQSTAQDNRKIENF